MTRTFTLSEALTLNSSGSFRKIIRQKSYTLLKIIDPPNTSLILSIDWSGITVIG